MGQIWPAEYKSNEEYTHFIDNFVSLLGNLYCGSCLRPFLYWTAKNNNPRDVFNRLVQSMMMSLDFKIWNKCLIFGRSAYNLVMNMCSLEKLNFLQLLKIFLLIKLMRIFAYNGHNSGFILPINHKFGSSLAFLWLVWNENVLFLTPFKWGSKSWE